MPKQAFSKQQRSHDEFNGWRNLESAFPTVRIQVAWNFPPSRCICVSSELPFSWKGFANNRSKTKKEFPFVCKKAMNVSCSIILYSSKMLQDHMDHPPKMRSECANVGLLPEILLLSATDR